MKAWYDLYYFILKVEGLPAFLCNNKNIPVNVESNISAVTEIIKIK